VGAGQVQCAWMSSIRLGVPCLVSWLSRWRFCSLSLPQHTLVLSMQRRYLNWSCTISFLYGFSSVQVIISEYRPYFIVLTCTEFSCTTSYLKRGGTERWNFLFCYKVFSSPVTSPYGSRRLWRQNFSIDSLVSQVSCHNSRSKILWFDLLLCDVMK
jgi:hypothetical protein